MLCQFKYFQGIVSFIRRESFQAWYRSCFFSRKSPGYWGNSKLFYELILTYSRGLLEIEWLQEEEKARKIGGDQVRILMSSYPLESQAQILAQRLTNGGPWARSGQSPVFINKALLRRGSGHNTFKCYMQLLLQYTVAELCSCTRLWSAKPKILTTCTCTAKVCLL